MVLASEEYKKIYASFDYSKVDLSVIAKHIDNVDHYASCTNSAIAIYDNAINRPVYMSEYYRIYFGEDNNSIHPDDYELYYKSSVIAIRYFFNRLNKITDHHLIRKYRSKVRNQYRVVNEQLLPIGIDSDGVVWLSLIIIDIATSQSPPFKFESKILNYKTGDTITPVDDYFDGKPILTNREIEILRLIEQGYLSKEISGKLSISVNTVSKHRQRILEKLKVNSSIEAIKYASAMGVL